MHEFGPVTVPAYEGASAGMRSLSDLFFSFLPGEQTVTSRRIEEFLARSNSGRSRFLRRHSLGAVTPLEPRVTPAGAPPSGRLLRLRLVVKRYDRNQMSSHIMVNAGAGYRRWMPEAASQGVGVPTRYAEPNSYMDSNS